ncbi:MAG TPA: alpha/beta hydrolase [Gaiellaceae bacterium]|nr:alpha/beta hydrolase [Gaiellaceae bacterium]
MTDVAEHTIDVDGVATHYHDAGEGRAVLLLHGSGPGVSAWANWRLVIPELAEGFRVIAPDQIGFNQTLPPADVRYGRELWTSHALRLMEIIGVESYDVVGNSMGGAIAFSMAAAQPDRIGRIVAMGTMGVAAELPEGLDEVWGYEPSVEAMRRLIELFAFDQSIVTDELVSLRYEASVAPGIQEAFSSMFPAPRQRWLDELALGRDELEALRLPVLLVHGWNDQVVPPSSSSLPLMDILSDVRLHAFGQCGHWVMIEQTRPFNALVARFLAG